MTGAGQPTRHEPEFADERLGGPRAFPSADLEGELVEERQHVDDDDRDRDDKRGVSEQRREVGKHGPAIARRGRA